MQEKQSFSYFQKLSALVYALPLWVGFCVYFLSLNTHASVQVIATTPPRISDETYFYMGTEYAVVEGIENSASLGSQEYINVKNNLGLVNPSENNGEELIYLGVDQPVDALNPSEFESSVSVNIKNLYPEGAQPPAISLVLSAGVNDIDWSLSWDSGIQVNKVYIVDKGDDLVFVAHLDTINVVEARPQFPDPQSRYVKLDVSECGYQLPSSDPACNTNKILGIAGEIENHLAGVTSLQVTSFSGAKHASSFEVRLGGNPRPLIHPNFRRSASGISWNSAFSNSQYVLARETAILDQENLHIFGTSPILGYEDLTIIQSGGTSYTFPPPSVDYYRYRLIEVGNMFTLATNIPVYLRESQNFSTSGNVPSAPNPFYLDIDPSQVPLTQDIVVSWPDSGAPYYRVNVRRDGGYWLPIGYGWEVASYQQETTFTIPMEWRDSLAGTYELAISSCIFPTACSVPLQQSRSACASCNSTDYFSLGANVGGVFDRTLTWSNASAARYLVEAKGTSETNFTILHETTSTSWDVTRILPSGNYDVRIKSCKDLTSECVIHGEATLSFSHVPQIAQNGFLVSWSDEKAPFYKLEERVSAGQWSTAFYGSDQLYLIPVGSPLKEYQVSACVSVSACSDPSGFISAEADALNTSSYNLLQGDFNGDGITDIILQSAAAGGASYVFLANDDGSIGATFQQLTQVNLGFDISAVASTLQVFDKNGDGNDDIEILQGGERAAILLSDAEGMFPTIDEEPVENATPVEIFTALCRALEAKNVGLAAKYFAPDVATRYEDVLSGLTDDLPQIANDFGSLHPVATYANYRSFAFEYAGPNNEQLVGIVVYLKDEDGNWRISSL